jgi:4-carboxymuconolactone decarboxylase
MTDLPESASPRSTSEIASFHAHIYYDPAATRPEAERLRIWMDERFSVTLGRWHDAKVGPHDQAMFQVAFAPEVFPLLVPWLMLNHGRLSILVHPNTTNPRRDHLADPFWIGPPLAVHGDKLPEEAPMEQAPAPNTRLATMTSEDGAIGKQRRFPPLTLDQLDAKQKPLGEQIMKVSSIGIAGPYNPMLRSPVLGQRLFDLFHYLRWETSVPIRLNEFAIIIIARQWRSQVEWYAHAPLAAKAGLSPEIIAELKAGKRPSSMAEDEAVVYDFVSELTTTRKISDPTFARARKVFSDQQIVDLTGVAGNYIMVAMLLAMAEETVPAGKEPPFKDGENQGVYP